MRGYGRSSVPPRQDDYALEHIATDMIELLDSLGHDKAVWVGHDWGSPVVWGIASHHPDRCHGVANLCVPYFPKGFTAAAAIELIDRGIYPEAEFPAGQWEYQLFYRENFDKAQAVFETDTTATVKAMFRKGDAFSGKEKPARTWRSCAVTEDGLAAGRPHPTYPGDADVLTEADLATYVAAPTPATGFVGRIQGHSEPRGKPCVSGQLGQWRTVGFAGFVPARRVRLHVRDDRYPLRRANASELLRPDGSRGAHRSRWMAQENPVAVNAALARWLAAKLLEAWPG